MLPAVNPTGGYVSVRQQNVRCGSASQLTVNDSATRNRSRARSLRRLILIQAEWKQRPGTDAAANRWVVRQHVELLERRSYGALPVFHFLQPNPCRRTRRRWWAFPTCRRRRRDAASREVLDVYLDVLVNKMSGFLTQGHLTAEGQVPNVWTGGMMRTPSEQAAGRWKTVDPSERCGAWVVVALSIEVREAAY